MNAKERNIVSDALHAIVCAKMPPANTDGFYTLSGVRVHKGTYDAIHYIDPTSDGKVIGALVEALQNMVDADELTQYDYELAQDALALARTNE